LVEPLLQPAYQFAVRLLGDRDLAEDVVQDALLKAYAGLGGFRGEARFRTWLFRIVHHACTDCLRRRARRREAPWPEAGDARSEEGFGELADPASGPEEEAVARVGRSEVLRAVASLPVDQRAVVLLRDVHDLPYEEIAAVTGQNLGTVKSRLHRARAALRHILTAATPPASASGRCGPAPAGRAEHGGEPHAAVGVGWGGAAPARRSPQEAE
jgi:RNA polymerase sigma-70 factor (ECF subfamily)